jgi:hypothetical protein
VVEHFLGKEEVESSILFEGSTALDQLYFYVVKKNIFFHRHFFYLCTPKVLYHLCGSSSAGRARPCQGRGREFESRLPLLENTKHCLVFFLPCIFLCGFTRPGGEIGRHAGLKILFAAMQVPVQVRPGALLQSHSQTRVAL